MSNGQWVIVRYSDSSWQSIKQICSLMTSNENLNENFRLWIIIEEAHTFPLDVLRISLKGIYLYCPFASSYTTKCRLQFHAKVFSERPNSLKEHMRKTFAKLNSCQSLDFSQRPNSLLYVFGFFHAVIQVSK